MLETSAELNSDDYAVSIRLDRAELLSGSPSLIIEMPLHRPRAAVARFLDRPDSVTGPLGGVFMVPPDHRLWIRARNRPPVRSFNCTFAPHLFDRLMANRDPLTRQQLARALDLQSPTIYQCMRQLMEEAVRPRTDSRRLTGLLAAVLLIELSRELFAGPEKIRSYRRGLSAEHVRSAVDYIQSFPTGVPSIAEIAERCGLSVQYFARRFRERTGQSVGRFIAASRIGRAERLLIETDLSLKEIAYRLGFANSAAFSTAFRSKMLVPPGRYRERRLERIPPADARHCRSRAYTRPVESAISATVRSPRVVP
jgi:AraC family transcriptional regulator